MIDELVHPHLYALVAAQVEVELGGVRDAEVDGGAGGDVPGLAGLLLLVGAEKARVVALLHHYECDARLVLRLQLRLIFNHIYVYS